MKKKFLSLFAFLLLACQTIFPLAIPLTVRNLIPVARNEVPVQMGIPFPKGKLLAADVSRLTVSDSITGQAVPAGITATVVWHDGSVRWIRLLFPATLPAGNAVTPTVKTYMLTDANLNTAGGLTASTGSNAVTVVTGPLKFTVKGANFNLIDEAWMNEANPGMFDDAHKVVTTGNSGGFSMKVGTTTYTSNTTTATVTLVESTRYHALIKATGTISQYAFTIYYYAYYNKPYVKVVHRFFYNNADGSAASVVSINDIALKLKTNVPGGTATFSSANGDGDTATALSGSQEAYLYYGIPDNYQTFSGTTRIDTGGGMNLAPGTYGCQTMGWGHMTSGTLGVAGAIRFMWQMAPKNISLLGTGEIGLHLWTDKGQTLTFYGGAGRAHFTGFAFTTSPAMANEMFNTVTQPLYAVAPAKWLTAQTKVLGELVPCDTAALAGAKMSQIVNQYRNMGLIHGHTQRRSVVSGEDSYGFLEFGDLADPVMDCGGRYWSNNYYDFPHCVAQAFLMTGSEVNAETGLMHALHLGDMDHNSVTGQSRTCPGWGNFGDYTACAIGYSGTSNHYKCQGLFDWSNILGEPILGDMGLLVAKWAQGYVGGEIRATGHVLMALSAAYAYTNGSTWKTYLEGAYPAMNVGNDWSIPFENAYVGEGIMWTLLEEPAFTTASDALRKWSDHWKAAYDFTNKTFGDYPSLACGYLSGLGYAKGFLNTAGYDSVLTSQWLTWSLSTTDGGPMGNGTLKTFTQEYKGPPHYFRWIKKAGYDPMTPDYTAARAIVTAREQAREEESQNSLSLAASPNPFNPQVTLMFTLSGNKGPVSLAIYNSMGQKICDVAKGHLKAGSYAETWQAVSPNGNKLGSGIYLVLLKEGNRTLEKKIILAK